MTLINIKKIIYFLKIHIKKIFSSTQTNGPKLKPMQHGGINKWKKACSPWSWLLTLEDFILIRVSSSQKQKQKQKREECCGEGKSLSRLVGKRRRFLPDRHSPFQFHFHPYQYLPRLSFSLRYWLYAPHRTSIHLS